MIDRHLKWRNQLAAMFGKRNNADLCVFGWPNYAQTQHNLADRAKGCSLGADAELQCRMPTGGRVFRPFGV